MKKTNTIASFLAAAVIVGGLIVGFDLKKPEADLSFSDVQTLIEVYNYEIHAVGGQVALRDVKGDAFDELTSQIKTRQETKAVVLSGETLSAADYNLLKSGLITKVEQSRNK